MSFLFAKWDWEKYAAVQREESREEGFLKGLEEGRAEAMVGFIRNVSKNLNIPVEQAMSVLGVPESERENI